MYSPKVIERSVAHYEAKSSQHLIRIPADKCEDWCQHLSKRLSDAGSKESLEKSLTREETLFIRNERVMSMLDMRYWAERYAYIQKDGGGICKFSQPWDSQEMLLRKLATAEDEIHDASARGEPVDGILVAYHKARQLGATAVGCVLKLHRLSLTKHRRAMCASVDDDKIQELYDRDKLIYDNLPFFLKPDLAYDEKRAHIYFESMDSRILYQVSSQKSGLGVGRQFDIAHLTEMSTWVNASAIELDFFPTLPQSLSTLAILESTAYGRGNWWHDFSERCRKHQMSRWRYLFVPWYAEQTRRRRQPPPDWKPSEVSLLHAQKVHDTSPEFLGRTIMLSREQLYWWESTREEYRRGNNLVFFLTSYPATPEESFQHHEQSAFGPELLEDLRLHARPGTPYELTRA